MVDNQREENLKYLRYLYEEYKKIPRSVLLLYDIINLENYLGIKRELPFEFDGMTGVLTYKKE